MIRKRIVLGSLAGLLLGTCLALGASAEGSAPASNAPTLARATFAGGCFWCMEAPFDALAGVISTTSGYTGGSKSHPTYREVSAGGTGHAEAVQVLFDRSRIGYAELLDVFWHNIDPTARDRQFCDVGRSYRSAIFTHDVEQKRLAEASRRKIKASGRLGAPIATEIVGAGVFWKAEAYHQDYYRKNPLRYRYYRERCGRDRRLEAIWGDTAATSAH